MGRDEFQLESPHASRVGTDLKKVSAVPDGLAHDVEDRSAGRFEFPPPQMKDLVVNCRRHQQRRGQTFSVLLDEEMLPLAQLMGTCTGRQLPALPQLVFENEVGDLFS